MGSPLYMSPEQVRSAKNVDHRTDIWSLGIILFELLTGDLPFEAETASAACAMIVVDPPIPLRFLKPDLPARLEEVILKCLEKDPDKRFQSVSEFAAALAAFASDTGRKSAERVGKVLEGPSEAPTLHGAPVRVSLADRAERERAMALAKTSPPTEGARGQASSLPVLPGRRTYDDDYTDEHEGRPRRRGGSRIARLFLLGVCGWGVWQFREEIVSSAANYLQNAAEDAGLGRLVAGDTDASAADDASAPSSVDGASSAVSVPPADASLISVPPDADTVVDAGDADGALDASDDDADVEEEDDDAATPAVATSNPTHVTPRPASHPKPKPKPPPRKRPRPRR